jgi:hypothetical protein
VGEASYQPAIRRCFDGQRVHIVLEPNNPYDPRALAVVTHDGLTIGYIARDCWLQDAIHDEGHGCEAYIKEISSGSSGELGVVLDVTLCDEEIGTRSFDRPNEQKGWLARIFGL